VRPRQKGAKSASGPLAVFLVGFMGAGKSSVGRILAQQLNWLFEDLDDRIVQREGRSVPQIFRDSGEEAFRQAEHMALRQVLEDFGNGVARVIALGGGAFAQPTNAALLRGAGVPIVFLDASVNELWRRCCTQANETGVERPLLQAEDQFRRLYQTRRKSYAAASFKIDTEHRGLETIAADIARKLGLKKIRIRTEEGDSE
jgi:shikimate kinase